MDEHTPLPILIDPETPDPTDPPPGPPIERRRTLVPAIRTTGRGFTRQCFGCGDVTSAFFLYCPACREWMR